MKFERRNTFEDKEIYENMRFKRTDSEIRNPDGTIVFSAKVLRYLKVGAKLLLMFWPKNILEKQAFLRF